MDSNFTISIKKKEELIHDKEIDDIITMIKKMAYETENKDLKEDIVRPAVDKLLEYPDYGQYFLIIDNLNKTFCGMNMITYEFSIPQNDIIVWIQSVYVSDNYRNQGLFRKLLQENESYIKSKDIYEKRVKLYMEKDNTKAGQVYSKLGFIVTDEILYELDYHFDNIDFLKNNNTFSNKCSNINVKIEMLNNEIYQIVKNNKDKTYVSVSQHNEKTINLNDHLHGLEETIKNDKLGKVIAIYNVYIYILFILGR